MAFQVPLDVLLHDPHHQRGLVPLAFAHSLPLQPLSSHDSSLTLAIEGSLHPSLAAYNGSDSPLTGFLNRFLNGNDNPIRVRYRHQSTGHDAGEKARAMKMKEGGSKRQTPLMMESEEAEQLPRYVEAFLKNLDFGMKFPGRIAGEELVERLGVERMRMSLGGGVLPGRTRLECSGQLWAWVGLPTELAGVGPTLRVSLVRPDVLLLDGPLPSPGSPPPPSSAVPENAFARIHPEAYIPASLAPLNDSSHRLALAAQLRNVPLLPLDNRHQVFRAYAAKYLRHHLPNWKDSPDQQQPSLLTSLIGSFSAHATLASRFHLLLLDVPLSGSFFV
ncbi:hypothetical protein VP01_761g13 [Puccinia sorghi]|uniref:Uncharacterized protein n=1 Tax=Puccinia sorghi TaxID=27349 RepID=A0A0L6UCR6_9BASI|nr:hypothetical protein VP01_761g13 [Puccinia sorghi]